MMPVDAAEVARVRLASHILLPDEARAAQPDQPAVTVEHMTAIQCQDLPSGLLAAGLRTRAGTARLTAAALASGQVVRTWTMRGTLFLVSAADVRTFLGLSAQRVMRAAAARHRGLGIDEDDVAVARRVAETSLAGGIGLTRKELFAAFESAGQPTGNQRGIHLLSILSHRLVIVQGPLRGRQQEFRLADEWLPGSPGLTGDDALEFLARRFLTSHGPADERDFAWWLGQPLGVVTGPFRHAAASLVTLDAGGRRLSCTLQTAALIDSHVGRGAVVVVPMWDELVLGYRDRSAVYPPDQKQRYATRVFKALITVGGRGVGTWTGGSPGHPTVQTELFEDLSPSLTADLAAATARVEAYWRESY